MTHFATIAPLFRYPDDRYAERLGVAQTLLSVPAIQEFAHEIGQLDLPAQQATYTSTFDLAPACSPYLGVHLFGDENRERARLMLGLRSTYDRVGHETDRGELPDHVAEVFAFSARADREEWKEVEALIVKPALRKMDEILRQTSNPYRHLISAALHLDGGES